MVLSVVLLLFASIALVQGDECSGVANVSKIDCKRFSKQDCENVGCCWSPAGTNSVREVDENPKKKKKKKKKI